MCSDKNQNIKSRMNIKVPCDARLLEGSVTVYTGAGWIPLDHSVSIKNIM